MGKFGQKLRPTGLSQAGRPGTSENSVPSSIQWQSNTPTMPLSHGLDVGVACLGCTQARARLAGFVEVSGRSA